MDACRLKCVKLEILSTLFIDFLYDKLGELRLTSLPDASSLFILDRSVHPPLCLLMLMLVSLTTFFMDWSGRLTERSPFTERRHRSTKLCAPQRMRHYCFQKTQTQIFAGRLLFVCPVWEITQINDFVCESCPGTFWPLGSGGYILEQKDLFLFWRPLYLSSYEGLNRPVTGRLVFSYCRGFLVQEFGFVVSELHYFM